MLKNNAFWDLTLVLCQHHLSRHSVASASLFCFLELQITFLSLTDEGIKNLEAVTFWNLVAIMTFGDVPFLEVTCLDFSII